MFRVDQPAGRPREPFFCLTHGAGGDLSSAGLVAMSASLAERGHLSVRFNLPYRAAGRRSPPAAEKSVPGFFDAYQTITERFGQGARWVAGGRSYGGRVASLAAVDGLKVAGLMFFPYPLHRPGDAAHPRTEHWPDIRLPSLFIQGTKDPFCRIDVLERSLPSLGAKPTLLLVEGGDHSLKTGASKEPGNRSQSEEEVVAGLMEKVSDWLSDL